MNSKHDAHPLAWRRMVAFVTVDKFRVQLEERENPLLEGRAFAIVTTEKGGTVLAASDAALTAGLRPGMRWAEALVRCPTLARVVARPGRYAEQSGRLMGALEEISPTLEVFDEAAAFIDLTDCQAYYRHDPERIARLIHATVARASNLPCQIGLGGDKTSARWAARQAEAGKYTIIRPEGAAAALAPHPVVEVLGIGPGMSAVLAQHGVRLCGDMQKLSIHLLARQFGNHGRRVWLMAQGRDPAPVLVARVDALRFQHQRRLPPGTRDLLVLQTVYLQLAERLAADLRREGTLAGEFRIGLHGPEGWREELVLTRPCADMRSLLPLCARFLRRHWFGEEVGALRLSACLGPEAIRQPDIFAGTPRLLASTG